MPFPNLALKTDPSSPLGVAQLWAEATGVPDNGNNTFSIPFINPAPAGAGIDPDYVDDDWFVFYVIPADPALVTGATWVSLSADKQFVTMNFAADGVTAATLILNLAWSANR